MYESVNECLIACVRAAGGSKIVGLKLWPAKGVEAAQRHLLACLNEGKAERLDPEHVLLIANLARGNGCHAYAQHVAQALSYAEPQPVEPKDEADELRRQFIESTRALTKMAERIEQLERPALRSAA